jgi:hypothetical protein
MTTDPNKHSAQPSFPNTPSISLRKYELRTALCYVSYEVMHAIEEISLPNQNTQRPKGCNQDGRRKCVGSKVGDFTKSHYEPVSISRMSNLAVYFRTCHYTTPPHGTL